MWCAGFLQEVTPKMCLLVMSSRQPVCALFFISTVMQIKWKSFPQQRGWKVTSSASVLLASSKHTYVHTAQHRDAKKHVRAQVCARAHSQTRVHTPLHARTHTHTQHVLCKAKMLLTVLNKTLNHLCQTEGSEKRERGEEAISLAGKMP